MRSPAEAHLLPREVHLQVAAPERRRTRGRAGHVEPAQHGPDARHELEVVEGFGDVVVCAELEALDLVDGIVTRGEHDDGDVGEGADLAQHLEAVDVRQADVEQDDVRVLVLDEVERGRTIAGTEDVDLPPLQREADAQCLHHVGLVVHDEDLRHSTSSGPSVGTTSVNVLPCPGSLMTSTRAAVRLGDGQGRGQTQADPLVGTVPIAASDEEALEEARALFGRDARPFVADRPARVDRARAMLTVTRPSRGA